MEIGKDRFGRTWLDEGGAEWSARVDRIALNCGACDLTRYLHVYAPNGERWTFTLAPDASLAGVSNEALQAMVVRAADTGKAGNSEQVTGIS